MGDDIIFCFRETAGMFGLDGLDSFQRLYDIAGYSTQDATGTPIHGDQAYRFCVSFSAVTDQWVIYAEASDGVIIRASVLLSPIIALC